MSVRSTVIDALREGHSRIGTIAMHAGVEYSQAYTALNTLVREGMARKDSLGEFHLSSEGLAMAAAAESYIRQRQEPVTSAEVAKQLGIAPMEAKGAVSLIPGIESNKRYWWLSEWPTRVTPDTEAKRRARKAARNKKKETTPDVAPAAPVERSFSFAGFMGDKPVVRDDSTDQLYLLVPMAAEVSSNRAVV